MQPLTTPFLSPPAIRLTPKQALALDAVLEAATTQPLISLNSDAGMGRTTVLRLAAAKLNAHYASIGDFVHQLSAADSVAIEETFHTWASSLLAAHDRVAIDDLHLIGNVACGLDYPRSGMLNLALTALLDSLAATGKQLLVGDSNGASGPIALRGRPTPL